MPTKTAAKKSPAKAAPGKKVKARRELTEWEELSSKFPKVAKAAREAIEAASDGGSEWGEGDEGGEDEEAGEDDVNLSMLEQRSLEKLSAAVSGAKKIYVMTVAWMDLGAEASIDVVATDNLKKIEHVRRESLGNTSGEAFFYVKKDPRKPAAVLTQGSSNGGDECLILHEA